MKDTDKVTLTLGQIKKLITESKKKKLLKETASGSDIIDDLVERAKSILDEGETDKSDAVVQAIDEGLIYTKDIYDLLEHYNSISDSEIIHSYYEELFNDIMEEVKNY